MKNRLLERSQTLAHAASAVARACLFTFLVTLLAFFAITLPATAQSSADQAQPQVPGGTTQGQTFAPIGESGYRVPIPEIKMKSIVGDRPPQEAPPAPREAPAAPVEEVIKPRPPSPEPPKARPVPKELPVPQVPRLPFEPTEPAPKVEAPPEPPAKKEIREKEYESPLLKVPVVPEDITASLPPPRKEVLPRTAAPGLPALMDVEPTKESLKTVPLDRAEIDDMADPRLWIRLDPRRGTENITVEPEPEPTRHIPKEETLPRPSPQEPSPVESIHRPMGPGVPVEEEPASPEKEEPTPLKESIVSPFGREAAADPEVGSYLKATAPILEELSLVMARTPSLTVADYDPSEANAPVFPKELVLKLDALKRELQILDSKTFEIIPPPQYAPFHSLIRQSITQTYQACDEIINFFNERNGQSLQQVRDHLLKARELIQKTRERSLG
ncbi:MAG: hypothetical protein HY913_02795 [Desulfomonile tiedjei]|nr:hypothetical protein [Desulfomonile tiedjei]